MTQGSARPDAQRRHRGFTLIELLVVIAIIAILAAILFPVFATAREKGRQAVCQSNLKQFMMAIIQYTNDSDEKMPLSVSGNAQVGPASAQANGIAEFGVHVQIMPYIKNRGMFQCPDDNGMKGAGCTSGGKPCAGETIADAWGSSYKYTKENFSIFPNSTAVNPPPTPYSFSNPTKYTICAAASQIGQPGGPYNRNPPFPMPVSFFLRPAETRVMRCFVAPWEETPAGGGPIAPGNPAVCHPNGEVIAFADGHVKWVKSIEQENSYCNGPTMSPARNVDKTLPGDGSCGAERAS